jgi:long-chain-alcohol oxidase
VAAPALGRRRRAALDAVADTFAPGSVERGIPDAFLELLVPRLPKSEQTKLALLLGAFAVRFPRLSRERRERTLLSWCDSRVPPRTAGFHALRKAILLLAWTLPGAPWAELGYPGPLGTDPQAPAKPLTPIVPDGPLELRCDVCVVGSGAGGGPAAAVLAGAGLDVVVLEAGGYHGPPDFDGAELDGLQRLYLDGATIADDDHSMGILAGSCLGGGTVVNYTTSFRTPDSVREEWGGPFVTEAFTKSLDAVCERLGVNADHNAVSAREELVKQGLEQLGWHVDFMPRDVRGCEQGRVCGYCPYGCRLGAKQSTDRTWLVDAERAGARIVVGVRAERIATGPRVEAGHVSVRARAVVVAAGAINTPALLLRSGLGNAFVGRNLYLHPVAGALGFFDEEVRPWEGTMQAIYSDELADLDAGYGCRFETTATHPGFVAAFMPWRGAAQHRELMLQTARMAPLGVLLRDREGGRVKVRRDGTPLIRHKLSGYDARHLDIGVQGAVRILQVAGARRVVRVDYPYYSFHQMGTARMGASQDAAACDYEGALWGRRDVVVCDGSAFPSASGVNPMITISALAHMNATALAARLS